MKVKRDTDKRLADIRLVDHELQDRHGAGDREVDVFAPARGECLRGELVETTEGERV